MAVRFILLLIRQVFSQQWRSVILMGVAYASVAGLIFMPLTQIHPQLLLPLWPFLLWGMVIICLLVGQPSLFDQDYQEGILEWYYVHHSHLMGYITIKYITNLVIIMASLLSVTTIFGWGLIPWPMLDMLLKVQAIAITALTAIHMVTSCLILNIQPYRRILIQMVILVPLTVPEILLGYGTLESGQFTLNQDSLFVLFSSLSILIVVLALAITPFALREILRG
jgi:ABC-type transport system involved in cytochrome c biogenesis permease component